MNAPAFAHGHCPQCNEHRLLMPLHGENGGPSMCQICIGEWHAEHGRKRQRGRIAVRAIKAFLNEGGSVEELDKLKLAALGTGYFDIDPLGYMHGVAESADVIIELTSELLADALQLTHPDHHPPARRELAGRVTEQLLALKPFVFPAVKPKPVKTVAPKAEGDEANGFFKVPLGTLKEPLGSCFPCAECASTVPRFYCDPCRAEWESRQRREHERHNAKQREQYARRKERRERWRRSPDSMCAECRKPFKPKRKDARFCSNACRQRAHQHGRSAAKAVAIDRTPWLESEIVKLFASEPDGAFTAEELCQRIPSNAPINKPAVLRAAKALMRRAYDDRSMRPGLGILRSWERGGEYVIFDHYSLGSYAAAHLKIGPHYGSYGNAAEALAKYPGKDRHSRQMRDMMNYEALSAPGGDWYRDVQYWIAKRDGDKATLAKIAARWNKERASWGEPPLADDAF